VAPGVAFFGGRDLRISLDSYRPPKPGGPRSITGCCPVPSSLGSWGLGTVTTEKQTATSNISDARKTAVINDELLRLKIDIAALQETLARKER